MRRRVLTALSLAVIGVPATLLGGPVFFIVLAVFIIGAASEYVELFRAAEVQPHPTLVVGGVGAILAARMFFPSAAAAVLVVFVFAAIAHHAIAYERGRGQAASDFGVTVAGLVYIGWIGAYLFDLRNLPEGGWWFMLVIPSTMLADTGSYSLGSAYGRHKLAARLSPKKTWEGYAAGVFTGALAGAFFAYAYSRFGGLAGDITPAQGAVLGLVLGALTPMGDLGESMFKRLSGQKDSGDVMPGHGGYFDRIDSWLWAGAIGYFFLAWLIL